jgi:hypothetical protein
MTQDQKRRVNALWVTSRGRLTQDDCIEIVTESDYLRNQREQCDPPWTWRLLALAIAAVVVIGLAISEGSL